MIRVTDYPLVVLVISVLLLSFALWLGTRAHARSQKPDVREDSGIVVSATLTLLGLIVGFSFSMAIGRYDQRKNLEEAEANAIGTEFVRADLLPAADAARVRALLRDYFDQRVLFYTARGGEELRQVNARTAQLQAGLWSAILAPAAANPDPVTALVVSGMNDVLNSQGYAQAALWNRIPVAAWALMVAIAICCHFLVGFCARYAKADGVHFFVLPLVTSVSFFLIAEIDSPRNGLIRVEPVNLMSIAESLRAPVPGK
jgi:hypothetical protein